MVNFPPTLPVGHIAPNSKATRSRRIVPSSAADRHETHSIDRRLLRDRRDRRGKAQIMDRRSGPERRRSSINFSV